MRNEVRVEEDSNHMTSQIIVDTSTNTVYNNTLRVRGRERGRYECIVSNNAQESSYTVKRLIPGMVLYKEIVKDIIIVHRCPGTSKSQCFL